MSLLSLEGKSRSFTNCYYITPNGWVRIQGLPRGNKDIKLTSLSRDQISRKHVFIYVYTILYVYERTNFTVIYSYGLSRRYGSCRLCPFRLSPYHTVERETSTIMSTAETRTDIHRFHLEEEEDGRVIDYEIRGLFLPSTISPSDSHHHVQGQQREEEEEKKLIQRWAEFCASVFSSKPNPPPVSYFSNHYHNDPMKCPQLIRVALLRNDSNDDKDKYTIVASCRLFLRTISLTSSSTSENVGSVVLAGGIGEVCTAPEHRRRGLSTALLHNVIEIMKERQLSISLLHAAPTFFTLYQSVGYHNSISRWSTISVRQDQLDSSYGEGEPNVATSNRKIRHASFPDDTDQLSFLHQRFSQQRFVGCIIRSKKYWNTYLSVEMNGSLFVLEDHSNIIIAWLSIRRRGDRIQLRDFGFDDDSSLPSNGTDLGTAFFMLLSRAVKDLGIVEHQWTLVLPTFLVESLRNTRNPDVVDWDSIRHEDDHGWMYKILDDNINIEDMNGSNVPHLIWPADSF